MNTKDIIHDLRTKHGLTQEQFAEKLFVTRQAVSRWETGETVPNTETLKLLSNCFNVSINTLLGSPQTLYCQCCGMPLDDTILGRNRDGSLNEDYCQWCYADGSYTYSDMDDLIDVCVSHMAGDGFTEEEARSHLKQVLPTLAYWRNRKELGDDGAFENLKKQLIEEINALAIPGMPKLVKLNALVTYLGNQLESEAEEGLCYGVLACADFILICTYGENGASPELLLYKKRMQPA